MFSHKNFYLNLEMEESLMVTTFEKNEKRGWEGFKQGWKMK